jgi:tellurite resistance protein TehA-like permease
MGVRDLYPGYFALVMATGICSTALRDVGQPAGSAALLVVAMLGFVVLCGALGWRLVRFPGRVLDDLGAPDRAFAFFTVVAASNVLAVRLAVDGHRGAAVALAGLGAVVWLALSYVVPVRLILGPRTQPVLAGVNGTWFIWVVGTQSIAVSASVLDRPAGGQARLTALTAVLMWSVGVVLYLMVATLVLTRLLLLEVRPRDLTPPYWVTMGATAITVLASAQILGMAPAPAVTAARPVVAGLGVMLWAFGTWLIPLLVTFGIWRHLLHRVRLTYLPALWSIVFPLGMYAVASTHIGAVAELPIIARIGHAWTWVAVPAWALVFAAMCLTLARSALRGARVASRSAGTTPHGPGGSASPAASGAQLGGRGVDPAGCGRWPAPDGAQPDSVPARTGNPNDDTANR